MEDFQKVYGLVACKCFCTIHYKSAKGGGVAGGSSFDGLTSMYLTNDGGLIAGGISLSNISGEKTENNRSAGYPDYWIVKYDNIL